MKIFNLLALLAPILLVIIGTAISAVIPGCKIDTGVGASDCGIFSDLLVAMILGGFCWFIIGAMLAIPVNIIGALTSNKQNKENSNS